MRELFAGILGTYGQRVSCPESGKSWRAFVQPVRGQASQEERRSTALGDVDQRRWLYIGPANREVDREDRLLWEGQAYRVRESVLVPFGDAPLYCRAVLVRERETVV